ncbi:unnamed protein product [Cylindrotheca closterium]|uniref:Uncharacterized protein n=1 Tax=Cylindrotheca closterium TaxID=2856 RepID=A0AAD2FR74_9STRA|nr:unnamed protein product [Cylindrotheca closterium]
METNGFASQHRARTPKRRRTNVLQLIYMHRHDCVKQLLPHLQALNWNDMKDSQDAYGSYPLHYVMFYCTGNGVLDIVRYILQQDPDALYKTTNQQMTPIHVMPGVVFSGDVHKYSLDSIQRDQMKARSFMMKQDASIMTNINSFGRLPLSEAVVKGCNRIAKQMLKEYPHLAFQKEANDRLPLYHAIQRENEVATTVLIYYYPKSMLLTPHCEDQSSAQPQTFLQMALASPTLALPVCQQLEKIMADMFVLNQELLLTQNKLKASKATLKTKNSEAKIAANQIEQLQAQLAMSTGGQSSELISINGPSMAPKASSRVAAAASVITATTADSPTTAEFDPRQEFYWKQTRKSEIICLNNLALRKRQQEQDDKPSVEDLKAIAKSLTRRLDCYTNNRLEAFSRFHSSKKGTATTRRSGSGGENKTMTQIAVEYCLKHPNPDRGDLHQTIEALNQELMRIEGKDKGLDDDSAEDESSQLSGQERKRQASSKQHNQTPRHTKRPKVAELNIESDDNDEKEAGTLWL